MKKHFLLSFFLNCTFSIAICQSEEETLINGKKREHNTSGKSVTEKEIKEDYLDLKPKKVVKELEKTNPVIFVKGSSGEIRIEEDMSEVDAKKKAAELARINAIENKFGKVIFQGNSVFIENKTTGQKVETNTKFSSISESLVKADWVTDDGVQYEKSQKNGERWISCNITGYCREIKEAVDQFKAEPLSCKDGLSCRTTSFVDGSNFFMYFTSAVPGYLSIFLTDKYNSSCILPYSKQTEKLFRIEPNKEYVLFSTDKDDRSFVDEAALTTENAIETDILYIIFSEREFSKPLVLSPSQKDNENILSPSDLRQRFELPKQTSSEEFMKWLTKMRMFNPEVTVKQIPITIQKH